MRQIGHCSTKTILNHGMPADMERLVEGLTKTDKEGCVVDTNFSDKASLINDNEEINNQTREKRLKALARRHGFKFTFIN